MSATWSEIVITKYTDGSVYSQSIRTDVIEHGVQDEKGRTVGGYVEIKFFEACPANGYRGAILESYFVVSVNATRNGKKFGAISRGTEVKGGTWEACKAFGDRKLAEQAKRYKKQFAVVSAA